MHSLFCRRNLSSLSLPKQQSHSTINFVCAGC